MTDAPKVELHVHMEGAFDGPHLYEMARRHVDVLPEAVDVSGKPVPLRQAVLDCADAATFLERHVHLPQTTCTLADFLAPFNWIMEIVHTAIRVEGLAALEEFALHFVKRQHASHVVYTEARYCPHLFLYASQFVATANDDEARYKLVRDVVLAMTRGFRCGEAQYGVTVRTILCCVDFAPQWSDEIARLLLDVGKASGCVAIDVAAGEGHFASPPEANACLKAVSAARAAGFGSTIHAGEDPSSSGIAANVRTAVEAYGATRIGHGYATLTDDSVLGLTQKRGIHFECCPTSSYLTGGFGPRPRPWSDHPLRTFHERGMSCGLNSDDPLVCDVCLSDDYQLCVREIGLDARAMRTLTENAIDAAFCAAEEKAALRLLVARYYDEGANVPAAFCREVPVLCLGRSK